MLTRSEEIQYNLKIVWIGITERNKELIKRGILGLLRALLRGDL